MFLKKEPFTFNGESLTVFELSALQRIEFLEFLAREEKALDNDRENLSDQEMTARLVGVSISSGARLIALSLWHNDKSGPSVDELHQQVMMEWPAQAIGKAEMQIKLLSGMLPPVADPDDGKSGEDATDASSDEPVTAGKP